MLVRDLRRELVEAADRLTAAGLLPGRSGNLSVRSDDGLIAVTPSGLTCGGLQPEQIVVLDLDGNVVDGALRPTSELPLHLALHRGTDARAVAHAHAATSTALSCVVDELPAVHYNVVALGGPPRVAPYATFGTEELAMNVLKALDGGRSAALLQNHGSLAIGATLDQACERLELLEWLCEVAWRASVVGSPRLLHDDDLQATVRQLDSERYGQPSV